MIKVLECNDSKIINVFIADSYTKRLFGYMFREKPHYEAIMLTPCNGIHTFFMKFNIDVLFLNEHMQVIIKIENLRPGQIVTKVMGSRIVIESKAGVFSNIKEGSVLNI
ncbi:MAG: DUF192 domain-containing protein [Clostridium sp.]|uniref:DUF192 domain-containing protein n=1 Tax=Clostridium sp. TaxID=1506 RepID=UPI003D6D2D4B